MGWGGGGDEASRQFLHQSDAVAYVGQHPCRDEVGGEVGGRWGGGVRPLRTASDEQNYHQTLHC